MPVAIEMIQLIAVPLGRECQSGDVVDNLTGLTLGILIGAATGWVLAARSSAEMASSGRRAAVVALAGVGLVMTVVLYLSPPPTAFPAPTTTPGPNASSAPTSGSPASTSRSVRVSSIPALLSALANDSLDEIVVANGTYHVSPAGSQKADSLWIGGRFANRTRPITVRAETPGGVTFDGGGARSFGGIWFVDGAHDQTWDGFVFANGAATQTGVIFFGEGSGVAPHHLTLRRITIAASCTGQATSATAPNTDHGIYVSQAIDGPHDLLFEDVTVDGTGGLASAFHFYHSDDAQRNAWNVTIRRLQVRGTQQAIMLWDPTLRNITIDTATISDALHVAVRYESPGASGIVLTNISSTGSGSGKGFESALGASPPGVTFVNNSFR